MILKRSQWPAIASSILALVATGAARAQPVAPAVPVPGDAPPPASSATSAPTASGPAIAYGDMKGFYDRDVTWDLNLEGGWGRAFGDSSRPVGFGRVRGGVLWVHEPWYSSAGLFYDFSSFTPATFGVQIEQMHLTTGLWVQAGGGVDVQPRPMVMAGLGWSLFGVELQYRDFGSTRDVNTGVAVYATVRIPVSIIARVFRARRGHL